MGNPEESGKAASELLSIPRRGASALATQICESTYSFLYSRCTKNLHNSTFISGELALVRARTLRCDQKHGVGKEIACIFTTGAGELQASAADVSSGPRIAK